MRASDGNGDKEGDGAAETREAGDKKGDVKGGKSDGDAYKEGDGKEEGECKGGIAMAMVRKVGRVTRVMATATKRTMTRKRARTFVILSSERKINVRANAKKTFPYLGRRKSQITNL